MFQKIAKHCANDASNNVHRHPYPWTNLFANLEYDKKTSVPFCRKQSMPSRFYSQSWNSSRHIEWITRKMKGLLTIMVVVCIWAALWTTSELRKMELRFQDLSGPSPLLTIDYITAWSMVIFVQNKSSIHPINKKIWGISWCLFFLRQIYENELSCG